MFNVKIASSSFTDFQAVTVKKKKLSVRSIFKILIKG